MYKNIRKCKLISKIVENRMVLHTHTHTHTHVILKSKKTNAITLISLVITVIILLILAGVSLNLVVGEDGIIKQASNARNVYEDTQNKEQIQLAIMSSIGTDLHIDLDKLKTEIDNIGGTVTGETFPVIAKKERTEVVINETGEISDLEKITEVENLPDSWEPAYRSNAGNDWYAYKDPAGNVARVNAPKLADGMTAIKYVQGTNTSDETFATLTDGSRWANAMTKDGSMWVWIPRFAYRITSGYHQSGTDINPEDGTKGAGTIEIAFLKGNTNQFLDSSITGTVVTSGVTDETYADSTKWILEPAFVFGDEQLEGFWFAKFEASNTDGKGADSSANDTSLTLQIKPNARSWTYISSANIFEVCLNLINQSNYEKYFNNVSNVDTHLTKNVEWGTVAYLAHSEFGLNGSEIAVNSKGYTTGQGAGNNNYNTVNGITASTTKNVYGIYDMSGGAADFVSACSVGNTEKLTSSDDLTYINKYIDIYSGYNNSKYGIAQWETSGSGTKRESWFNDYSDLVGSLAHRGGLYNYGASAGLFAFNAAFGSAAIGFHLICVVY